MTLEEIKEQFAAPFISRKAFKEILGVPKYVASKIFTHLRHQFVEELQADGRDASLYDDLRYNYLPTVFIVENMPELKRYMGGTNKK